MLVWCCANCFCPVVLRQHEPTGRHLSDIYKTFGCLRSIFCISQVDGWGFQEEAAHEKDYFLHEFLLCSENGPTHRVMKNNPVKLIMQRCKEHELVAFN